MDLKQGIYVCKNSKSDFIGLCDSDDKWKPFKIKNEWSYLKKSIKNLIMIFLGSYTSQKFLKKDL